MNRAIGRLARWMAYLGGVVLSVLILMVCASVVGRSVGLGAVRGDVEMVESGMAFVIFAFMPLCQLNGAHAAVDIFTAKLPHRTNQGLQALIEVIFAIVLVLIAWQLFQGMLSKKGTGQTSFLLQYPVWWGYAGGLVGAVTAALVGLYMAFMRSVEFVTGRDILPPAMEADH